VSRDLNPADSPRRRVPGVGKFVAGSCQAIVRMSCRGVLDQCHSRSSSSEHSRGEPVCPRTGRTTAANYANDHRGRHVINETGVAGIGGGCGRNASDWPTREPPARLWLTNSSWTSRSSMKPLKNSWATLSEYKRTYSPGARCGAVAGSGKAALGRDGQTRQRGRLSTHSEVTPGASEFGPGGAGPYAPAHPAAARVL